jgi:hypothetical protein
MLSIKSETKVIRPFSGAQSIKNYMNDAELHLCDNDPDATKEHRFLVDLEFDDTPLIRPNLTELELDRITEATGIQKNQLSLAVWMTIPSAKRIQILKVIDADTIADPEGFTISRDILDAARRRSGVVVSLALVLNQSLAEAVLKPTQFGQWLVKKDFKISQLDNDSNKIDIQELTEDVKKRFHLPAETAYYVDYSESAFLAEADGTIRGAMTIYFDSDSLQRLRRGTKSSDAVQVMILTQIIPELILESMKRAELNNFAQLDPNSPLRSLFKGLSETGKVKIEEVFNAALKSPERLRAYVQANIQAIRAIKEMI